MSPFPMAPGAHPTCLLVLLIPKINACFCLFVCRRTAPGGPTRSHIPQEGTAGISSCLLGCFLNMENVRVFLLLFFFIICGAREKKKKLLSTIPVVFKRMPVLNVHISYGPDDDFWEGLGRADCRRTRWECCVVLLTYPSCAERCLPL